MKKLLLLLALVPCWGFAQTKEETEKWLLAQVPIINHGLQYKFDDGDMVYVLSDRFGTIKRTIPISKIKSVDFLHTDKFLAFTLKCEDECAYSVATDENNKFKWDAKKDRMFFELYAKLDKDMPARVQKALLHLIELHGGKAKAIPYTKPKEAF